MEPCVTDPRSNVQSMDSSSESFIAFGESEFDLAATLGVLAGLAATQQRCDECPGIDEGDGRHGGTAFRRYLIEVWKVCARGPEWEWVRDANDSTWKRIDWAAEPT